jgi:antirestriction protein ArdC
MMSLVPGLKFRKLRFQMIADIRDDHAAYLGHWLKVLKEDKRAIFSAAAHAQRAADFLNSLQPQQQQEEESAAA